MKIQGFKDWQNERVQQFLLSPNEVIIDCHKTLGFCLYELYEEHEDCNQQCVCETWEPEKIDERILRSAIYTKRVYLAEIVEFLVKYDGHAGGSLSSEILVRKGLNPYQKVGSRKGACDLSSFDSDISFSS